MMQNILDESFEREELDGRLKWFCPPQSWRIKGGQLVIEPEAKTDFWQKTHYGFSADNGHFFYLNVEGDFILSTRAHFRPANQYDQAGLMVRVSPDCWLKTSVEYEGDEPSRLGAVVTNSGYSDWSTQNFPAERREIELRIRREASDYIVEYADEENSSWTQIRMARLQDGGSSAPVQCGLYACSPIGAGFLAAFDYLRVEGGRAVE